MKKLFFAILLLIVAQHGTMLASGGRGAAFAGGLLGGALLGGALAASDGYYGYGPYYGYGYGPGYYW